MKPLAPLDASPRLRQRYERILGGGGGWAVRRVLSRWIERIDVVGSEHLASGPLLVLMNHTNALDPLLLTVYGGRPIQFLVTEPVTAVPGFGHLLSWLGQIPKRKLDAEARAFRRLKAWGNVGSAVGLFPEGQFPWDGRPLALQSGLGQLVAYLDVPVVTCRLHNGDRLWPPWAPGPRRTRLRLEIDPPFRFARGDDAEAVVARRIHVDPDATERWPATGRGLARGLARILRFCPACATDASLSDAGDVLRCSACARAWNASGDLVLRSSAGNETMTVADAFDLSRAHFRRAFVRSRRLTSLGPVDVLDITRQAVEDVASGPLVLDGAELRVSDFRLDRTDVLAHTVDWGQRVVLRTERRRLALRMPQDSRAIWTDALGAWGES